MSTPEIPHGWHLGLRTSHANGASQYTPNFLWPESGWVEAPDWRPTKECGHGLHFLTWGEGDGGFLLWVSEARWQVVAYDPAEAVLFDRKGKARRVLVVHSGTRQSATDFLITHGAQGRAVVGVTLAGGDWSTLTGGDGSTLTGGYGSTLTGGDRSTLTGGDRSTLTGGDGSTLTGGDWSTLTGGDWSTLTGGDRSTLTGGYGSTLTLSWWDSKAQRKRLAIAYVGEDGIEPGVAYQLDEMHKFARVGAALEAQRA